MTASNNMKNEFIITCLHCGKDITDQVNKATASRAGKGNTHEHLKKIAKERWDAYRAKNAEKQG